MNSFLVIFTDFCDTIFKSYDRDSPTFQKGQHNWSIWSCCGAYHDISAVIFMSPKNCQKSQKKSIIKKNLLVVQKGPQNWPIQPCDVSWYICCNGTLSPIQGADGRCKPLDICPLSLFFLWKRMKIRLDKCIG